MPECDGPPVFIRPTSGLVLPRGTMLHRALLVVPSALRSFRVSAALIATTASADFSCALAQEISPGKDLNFPRIPSGSTLCVLMSFGLRVYSDARRPQQASLPVRIPMVAGLPSPSFILRLTASDLGFGYGCSHQLRCHRFMFISSGPCRAHECGGLTPLSAAGPDPPSPALRRRLSPSGSPSSSWLIRGALGLSMFGRTGSAPGWRMATQGVGRWRGAVA